MEIREQLGDPAELAAALAGLAPIQWALTRPPDALDTSRRAVALLAEDGDTPRHAWTLCWHALLLTGLDRYAEAVPVGAAAVGVAERIGANALLGWARTIHGRARFHLGDDGGFDEMVAGVATAAAVPHHQNVLMGQIALVQELWLRGRYAEVEQRVEEAVGYGREHDLDYFVDYLLVHRHRLQAVRGDWADRRGRAPGAARRGRDGSGSGTGAARHALPALAQLLVRRGADDAQAVLARAVDVRQAKPTARYELVPALLAEIEQAWLLDRPAAARAAVATLAERTAEPGAERQRGELLRWQRRLGEPVEAFPGCPEELAAGIRGDWRAAADAVAGARRPVRRGAGAGRGRRRRAPRRPRPARRTRRRARRRAGAAQAARARASRLPRGPKPTTRENPAGLTDRQVEILRAARRRPTNAEIAARLVLSVRTVDHHVSAVLQKLGVPGRREAIAAAADLGLAR